MAKIPPPTPPFNFPEPLQVVEGLKPFDMGAPPAELPEGSSNLPWFNELPETPTRSPAPAPSDETPSPEMLLQIQQHTPEQQALMLEWWPRAWNKPSKYLDNKYVWNLTALLMHIEEASKEERKSRKQTATKVMSEHGAAYVAWTQECSLRLQWIESKNSEWRRRVAEKEKAMAQWDVYVAQARDEYRAARATATPPRPVRSR
jgi:hypothetical protein